MVKKYLDFGLNKFDLISLFALVACFIFVKFSGITEIYENSLLENAQLIPLALGSIICFKAKNKMVLIEEPEIHLHPKAQAAFGEIIYDTSRAPYNNQVVIETHSDYTIDRNRYMIRQKGEKKKKTQILFFARTKTGNIIKPIKISENGSFPEKMPKEYGKFFVDEELKMLSL